MPETTNLASLRFKARLAGGLYLLSIVTGLCGAFAGNAHPLLATAANIAGSACYVGVTLLLYELLKPAGKSLSLLAAVLSLTGCALMLVDTLHLATLPFEPIVFFGPYCLLLAYLILTSGLLPRIVGALLILTGLGWLTFLYHPLAHIIARYVMGLGLLGEGSLTIALLAGAVRENQPVPTGP